MSEVVGPIFFDLSPIYRRRELERGPGVPPSPLRLGKY